MALAVMVDPSGKPIWAVVSCAGCLRPEAAEIMREGLESWTRGEGRCIIFEEGMADTVTVYMADGEGVKLMSPLAESFRVAVAEAAKGAT